MAWAVMLAQADGTKSSTWLAIVLAVLGSSAIGAVVGGFLTVSYRARFEREEAWRTRLVEAADTFCSAQNESLVAGMTAISHMAGRPEEVLDKTGELTKWASQERAAFARTRAVTITNMARLDLLFGPNSRPVEAAWATVKHLREGVDLVVREAPTLARHGLDPGDYEAIEAVARQEGDYAAQAQADFARAASATIRGETLTGEWRWG